MTLVFFFWQRFKRGEVGTRTFTFRGTKGASVIALVTEVRSRTEAATSSAVRTGSSGEDLTGTAAVSWTAFPNR